MNEVLKRNNVKLLGEGEQALVFVHGYGCNQEMWRFITPAFEKNYQIVLLDLVGSGSSDISAYNKGKYDSLKGHAKDVLEICQELSLDKPIFIGHSVSSMIGLHAGIQSPGYFDKIIMVGPSPCYLNDGDYKGGFSKSDILELIETLESNYLGWSSAITPAIMGNPDKPELAEELNNSFCQTDPAIAKHFAKVTFMGDDRAYLPQLETETLILQCSSDIIAPREVGDYLNSKLPNSSLKVLEATGHCPHMSAPEETIEVINAFLKD